MIRNTLARNFMISLLGHLVIFSVVNFSFGARVPRAGNSGLYFTGSFLSLAQISAPKPSWDYLLSNEPWQKSDPWFLPESLGQGYALLDNGAKPEVKVSLWAEKAPLGPPIPEAIAPARRKESVVMFYPELPYHFLLYFEDRQEAHLELEFLITSYEQANSVAIRRKISSGNLEVDLLSMRYLNHYLSTQLGRFPLNQWQKVKIDFRPRNQ